jgi:hypothetical protein
MHAKTAIPLLIVSIPITFDSMDGVETQNRGGPCHKAKISRRKANPLFGGVLDRCNLRGRFGVALFARRPARQRV